MSDYKFSYDNYCRMLDIIKSRGTLKDYREISADDESFIILRHDVEFSPKRAYDLAVVEAENGVQSTYFFQMSNNAYNILSGKNKERIKEISDLGHKVGLHFHLQGSTDLEEIKSRIQYECKLMADVFCMEIDRFSFHRPTALVLREGITLPGIINAYDPMFFTYSEKMQDIDVRKSVKYIADSRNEWSYISPWESPCIELFDACPKMQILCHPYSWSEEGYTILDNLKSLIEENRKEFTDTLNTETNYVKEYIHEL